MANILGLHGGHDGSVCLVKNNRLVCAISTERLTKQKKCFGWTDECIDYVLSAGNMTLSDIDCIAISHYSATHNHSRLVLDVGGDINQWCQFDQVRTTTCSTPDGGKIPVYILSHHLSHCASSFYTSPYESATSFSLDSSTGYLSWNSLICQGSGNKLNVSHCPGLMVGNLYLKFTYNLGLGDPLYKAGSAMGLASYGNPLSIVEKNLASYVDRMFFSPNQELQYEGEFQRVWNEIAGTESAFDTSKKDSLKAMNIAASLQLIFEEAILKCLKSNKLDNQDNLCVSGGSMLNCNVNTRIKKETEYKNVHLFPGCGDDGIAIGCALYVCHHILGAPREIYSNADICYLGKAPELDVVETDVAWVAKKIKEGKIVAWMNGKSEYGPRALGHRSILADPRNFHNRELLNFVVKRREWFRPFAPSVLAEDSEQFFDFAGPSPFMLFTAKVKLPKEIPAVTHIDNSARMQTVERSDNPEYYDLIKEFKSITGIPMLVNTSLNADGQPILETREDGKRFLENSNVDILVLDGEILQKTNL